MEPPALCADLDGTLVATDTLWESVLLLIHNRPQDIWKFPVWLAKGKARFKREIANRVQLDVATLPYRNDVLQFLKDQAASGGGRRLALVSASDSRVAEAVAQYLGIFSEVLGSDGITNLGGAKKGKALEARFGRKQFDYIGDSRVDLPVWAVANSAMLVAPSRRLLRQAGRCASVVRVFSAGGHRWAAMAKALRVHQWVKNLLVFVPLVTGHKLFEARALVAGIGGALALCLCASGVYILNDLLDLEADRRHPVKQSRPFASGAVSIPTGFVWAALLLAGSVFVATWLTPPAFVRMLLLYFTATTAYSLYFKTVAIADVIILGGLYTFRILAGGAATGISISAWLLAFSMFLFLSLAFLKRYAELVLLRQLGQDKLAGRAYEGVDKEWLASVGTASGYLSVLVLALYINSQEVMVLYRDPATLWLLCPLLLYWITRMWMRGHRGQIASDPLIASLKDGATYWIVGISALLMLFAT